MHGSYRSAVPPRPGRGRDARRTSPLLVLLLAFGGLLTNGFAYLIIIGLFGAVVGADGGSATNTAAETAAVGPTAAATTSDAAPTTTPPPTTTSAAPVTLTVVRTDNADRVVLTDGTREVLVRVAGIDAPDLSGGQCWSAEGVTWATTTLVGKTISIGTAELVTDAVVTIALPDGADYAGLAIAAGAARATDTVLAAAETTARTAGAGLWGAPCRGQLTAPPAIQPLVPSPAAKPRPATTQPAPAKPAPTQPKPPAPKPPAPPADVYYANCAAAKAAGAAPLYRGQPGYRSGLDRDDDGVACET